MVCFIFSECKNMSVWEMFSWRSPKVTGFLLAIVLSIITIFLFMEYTLVTFACRVFQFFIAGGAVYTFILKRSFTSDDVECAVNNFVDAGAPVVMRAVKTAHDVVTWRDPRFSGVLTVVSFMVAFLGSCMSDCWFAFIFTMLAFTCPVIYDKNKELIDHWINVGITHVDKYLNVVKTKVDGATKKQN